MARVYILIYIAGLFCGAATIKFIILNRNKEKNTEYNNYTDDYYVYNNLTKLPNGIYLENEFNTDLDNTKFNILYIDIDGFKIINETLGYSAGDIIIQQVANRLQSIVAGEGRLFHIRGDEFVALLNKEKNLQGITDEIIDSINKPFISDYGEVRLTTSIGVASYPLNASDISSLIKSAYIAVHSAKKTGRNKVEIYNNEMNNRADKKLILINNLHKAIENEEFQLHYQPQIKSLTGEIAGLEALIRWKSPELGTVSPGEFIPLAEETGLIVPLGDWVLKTACAQAKAWQETGYINVPISINISTLQFLRDSFVDKIIDTLNEADLEPKWIHLEITESIALKDVEFTMHTLNRLKEIGIKVALDDFGTGFSSLEYLNKFNIDILKIDTSFIKVIGEEDTTVTNSIIVLGKSLNMNIIAEGVETNYQFDYLRKRGCDMVQGYLFSRPVSSKEIEKIFKVA